MNTIALIQSSYRFAWIVPIFLFSPPLQAQVYEYDPENGEEINELCAGCHGEFGQGGKEGEYPRLAGQPPWLPV